MNLPRDEDIDTKAEIASLRLQLKFLKDTIQDILKTQTILVDIITKKEG